MGQLHSVLISTAYLPRLSWIAFKMGGKWSYKYCYVGCCFQDLSKTALIIFVKSPPNFVSGRFVHTVQLYISADSVTAWTIFHFIFSEKSDSLPINITERKESYSIHFKTQKYGLVWFSLVWFSLVSMFNGISTFVGYLMPKSLL